MKKISLNLSRNSLLTIYKTFIRSILDYADIIYEKRLKESFEDKLEIFQYNAALVITGAIKGTLRDRINRELDLESLAERKLSNKIFFFREKMVFYLYIYSHLSVTVVKEFMKQDQQIKRTLDNFLQEQKCLFESFFFPYCIKEWNNFIEELLKTESTLQFKTKILSSIKPKENSIFKIHDIDGIKLLSPIRLHFSYLNEHKCWHNFRATIDPMCSCGLEPETPLHYFLH